MISKQFDLLHQWFRFSYLDPCLCPQLPHSALQDLTHNIDFKPMSSCLLSYLSSMVVEPHQVAAQEDKDKSVLWVMGKSEYLARCAFALTKAPGWVQVHVDLSLYIKSLYILHLWLIPVDMLGRIPSLEKFNNSVMPYCYFNPSAFVDQVYTRTLARNLNTPACVK